MVSKVKLYKQLDQLEVELQTRIIPHLEIAANGQNDLIFCVADFNTSPELKNKTDKETEALIGIGARILLLKEKMGESSEGSIAEKICWYCREWSNKDNHHRKNAQDLAKQFLLELEQS